jgi:hypothetical protein
MVWVQGGPGRQGLAANNADYLSYFGIDASAPRTAAKSTPAHTQIVVYGTAAQSMAGTIVWLQRQYGVTATTAPPDPKVTADIVVTLGADAPTRTVPTAG